LTKDPKQILAENNLTNVIKEHTRITDSPKTLIVFAITSNPTKILKNGTYRTGISDHDLIFVAVNLFQKKVPHKLISVRNYKDIDIDKIKCDLEAAP